MRSLTILVLIAGSRIFPAPGVQASGVGGAGTRMIPVAAGEALCVTAAGAGPPVVLIPHLGGSAYSFRKPIEKLVAAGFLTVVIEPLGFGSSTRPAGADYSLEAQAARVDAVLTALDLPPAVVVAQSISTSIAFRLALRRPDRVAGIVSLEGGVAESTVTAGFRRAMTFAGIIGKLGGTGLLRREMARQMRRSSADPGWVTEEVVEGYAAGAAENLPATLDAMKGMARATEPALLAPRLSRVTCPVEVLLGGAPHASGVPAEEVEILRAELPNARIFLVPGAGLFIAEEKPGAVVTAVRRTERRSREVVQMAGTLRPSGPKDSGREPAVATPGDPKEE